MSLKWYTNAWWEWLPLGRRLRGKGSEISGTHIFHQIALYTLCIFHHFFLLSNLFPFKRECSVFNIYKLHVSLWCIPLQFLHCLGKYDYFTFQGSMPVSKLVIRFTMPLLCKRMCIFSLTNIQHIFNINLELIMDEDKLIRNKKMGLLKI